MSTPQSLLGLLTDINFDLHELKALLSQSDDHLVQFLKPLTLGKEDENGDRSVELGSQDFAPQEMPWPECLDSVYGYSVMPDRMPSSLPRHLGYIVIPKDLKEQTWSLVLKINKAKEMFHAGCKKFYKDLGISNHVTHSQFLREQQIFNNNEHYEMVIRPIITSRHAYAKGNRLPDVEELNFATLTAEDEFTLKKLALKWLPSNYTQVEKGTYSQLINLKELENKPVIATAMQRYEKESPNTTFVKRFYLPPAPIAHYCFSDKWLSNKFTVNSPILVFDAIYGAEYKARLPPIDVKLVHGTPRSTKSLLSLSEKVTEIEPGSNWYALLA